jgi:hypothetical protein
MKKFEIPINGMATAISRFSLGLVLALMPILFAFFYDHDSAKIVALAINLSNYSSWLALGGYGTVMRDFRLMDDNLGKFRLNTTYQYLAIAQSIGAVFLTFIITITYIHFAASSQFIDTQNLLFIGLIFGIAMQCSSFWINIALGISYSTGNFIGISVRATILRTVVLISIISVSYISVDPKIVLIISTILCSLGSIILYRKYSIKFEESNRNTIIKWQEFFRLLVKSVIYFKWSVLATAVFVFPVTAIAATAPDILLSATIVFFLAGASQNLIAAFITPQSNNLLDGVGDLSALKAFFLLTAKVSAIVTTAALLVVWLLNPFMENLMPGTKQLGFMFMAVALLIASGFRAWTLAPTQAAIALKKEKLVLLSPILEALTSIIGVSLCWFFERGDLIFWIFILAVLIRLLVTRFWEINFIVKHWGSKI